MGCRFSKRCGFRATITFAYPQDAALWCVGDIIRTSGESRVVTWVGHNSIEIAPATWWRLAFYWLRWAPFAVWFWAQCAWYEVRAACAQALQPHAPPAGDGARTRGSEER